MANSILSNNPTQLLTKAKVNVSDWLEYTPTFQGFGTPTNVKFFYRRNGASLDVYGSFIVGVTSATEPRIGLPNSLTIAISNTSNAVNIVGQFARGSATTLTSFSVLATNGDNFVNLGTNLSGNSALALIAPAASSIIGDGESVSFEFSVPIQGWSSEAEFLAPLVQPKTAHLRVPPNNNQILGSDVVVNLDTVDGFDKSIVSLSSNQFSLEKGKYLVEYKISAAHSGTGESFGKVDLYNVTDGITVQSGIVFGGGNGFVRGVMEGYSSFEITEGKVYELRASNVANSGTHTLFLGIATSDDNGHVKITKLL